MRYSDQESIGAVLHRAGLRTTLPRRAVLTAVQARADHVTAEEVRRALQDGDVDLPRSSINNVLDRLARAGLIGRVDTLPGPTRFEAETSPHDHFQCRRCRAISNVAPTRLASPPHLPGSLIQAVTTYFGICDGCAEE